MLDVGPTFNSLLVRFGDCCPGQNGYYQLAELFDIGFYFLSISAENKYANVGNFLQVRKPQHTNF